ncbi:G-type lectin S-receptor-like serine/threonine-protein kinase At4g27290 isoform X1 [Salvia hispanica]|uniref:G-type lectin S-receptor-like serine/threonine-protein kinase At4g27290 isoform X1 n=2 Tax=Salvia hispanica TaxID=49212 RepID=UPI0020093E99|nr:G-type lectin S-receptor-like serine/threonine-protein kinase At4g27290 isoform X1 [Salvia hispanica]
MKTFLRVISSLVITASLLSSAEKMPLAMDTIAATDVIRDGDTLVSSGGSFEMGFFSLGSSKNRYLGIWYKKVSVQTAVWVANRGTPLGNTSGVLKFIEPGTLALLDESNRAIWSANTSSAVKIPIAQLLDTGNLVVRDANDPNKFLWQSFDHPTDTLLPGMKLGWDFAAGVEFYLSSWKSYDDPAAGDFTYHCDPTGYPQNVLRQGRDKRYSTGPWNGHTFSGLPGLRRNPVFRFGLVMNENEVYYHYELINTSVISRYALSQSGVGQRWSWDDQTQSWRIYLTAPTNNCDFYNLCGSYGVCNTAVCGCLEKFVPKDAGSWERGSWSGGCVRRKPLDCQSDGFVKYSGIKLPDTEHSWYNRSMNLEGCKELCFKNCSCTAYTIIDADAGGHTCLIWLKDLVDIKQLSADGQDIYIRMAASDLEYGRRRGKVVLIVVLTALVASLLLLCLGLFLYSHRRKKTDLWPRRGGSSTREDVKDLDDESHSKDLELPLFELSKICKATDDFSFNSKIGEGGFGPVYKGVLDGGQEIAVKRLSRTSLQGVNEFKNEVICVAKLQHRNLVKLLGCCICGEEYLLIYEYMHNRSLDLILFDPLGSKLLGWPKRYHIINGIARGLLYLHQDSRLRIIHRDLKASNVLLDSDMNPKISDFGLARSFGGNETGANTSRVVGTYGYMSPEYAVDGLFSVKSDVFSFGVLVLEIVSGKRNRGFSHRDHFHNLLGHAWMLHIEGNALELIKSYNIKPEYSSEVARAIHVGLLCVQQSPEDRPTMSSVVLMLGNQGELPPPKKPGFFTERNVSDTENSLSSSNAHHSTNEMSITLLEAR